MNIEIINQAVAELKALRERLLPRLPENDKYLQVYLGINGCTGDADLMLFHSAGVDYSGPPEGAEEAFLKSFPNAREVIEKRIAALQSKLAAEQALLEQVPEEVA